MKLSDELKAKKAKTDTLLGNLWDQNKRFFNDREEHRLRFEGISRKVKGEKEKWQNNYVSPIPMTAIEQKASYLTESITSSGPEFLEFETFDNIESEDLALAITRVVSAFMRRTNPSEKLYKHCKDLLIDGSAVFRVFYDYRVSTVIEESDTLTYDEEGNLVSSKSYTEKPKVDFDQPNFETVQLNNFWVDTSTEDIDDASCMAYRQLIHKSVLDGYTASPIWNIDPEAHEVALKASVPQRTFARSPILPHTTNSLSTRFADYDIDTINKNNYNKYKDDPIIELIWLHKPYKVQLIVNGIPITDEKTIYPTIKYPFIMTKNQPKTGECFGRSDIDQITQNIRHHEEMVNLIKDGYIRHLRPQRIVDSSVDQASLERLRNSGPDDVIVLHDPEALREFRPDSFDTTAVNFSAGFIEEAKKTIAINPMMEGTNPGSGIRSEGSLEFFQQIGATRTSTLLNSLVFTLERLGTMFVQLMKQFSEPEIVARYVGKLGQTTDIMMQVSDIPDDIGVKVKLSPLADPQRKSRIQEQLTLIKSAVESDTQGVFNVHRAFAEVFAESRLFEDPYELWHTDPQVILSKQILAAQNAGKPQPSTGLTLSPLLQAQQQQQVQLGSAASVPTANEGNPNGNNQFS